jgi:hypothetical protein
MQEGWYIVPLTRGKNFYLLKLVDIEKREGRGNYLSRAQEGYEIIINKEKDFMSMVELSVPDRKNKYDNACYVHSFTGRAHFKKILDLLFGKSK